MKLALVSANVLRNLANLGNFFTEFRNYHWFALAPDLPWEVCRSASVNHLNGHFVPAVDYIPRGVVTHV